MDTTVSDPVVGQTLDGRYRVVSRIARGGMGTVYLALDARLERTVALKVMHPSLAEDQDFVRRFIGEAKAAARLSHPNVVGVYDQGQDSGYLFLAMEYVPGRTLRDVLGDQGRLDPAAALAVLEPVAAALGAAHRAGLVHRDVKPENVLIAEDGRVKVTDFGLARAFASSSQTNQQTKTSGLLIGTVAYLAPEQVERGAADPRSDVYAAGVMLYELLTGRPPFTGESALAVAYQHVNSVVPAPSTAAGDVPPTVDALVAEATDRDPERRPADGSRLLGAVQQVQRGMPPAAGTQALPVPPDTQQPTQVLEQGERDTLVVPRPSPYSAEPGASGAWGDGVRGRIAGRTFLLTLAAVALLLGTLGVGYAVLWTTVPSGLAGVAVDVAKARAKQSGFDVRVAPAEFHDKVPRGTVITTNPEAGEQIVRGGTIVLVPSKGPRLIAVPDVRGMPVGAAKREIRSAGLEVGAVSRRFSPTVPEGDVIGTKPAIGDEVRPGSAVRLVVSGGVQVPDVRGWVLERAEEELRRRGFDVDISDGFSGEYPKGRVMAQRPLGGGASRGTTIELTVSQGPEIVPVPDVVGKKVDDAVRELRAAGFEVRVHELGGDTVRFQRPRGEAPEGSAITLLAF